MDDRLKDFLLNSSSNFAFGYVKFEGDFYSFSMDNGDYSYKKFDFEEFKSFFNIFAEEKLRLFLKTLEGLIHNSNGKISPVVSRLGLLEPKIESLKDNPEYRGVDRVFQKIVKSVKDLMGMYDSIGDFLMYYGMDEEVSLNLKRFFDGFHQAVITDREIKHKVVFDIDIDEFINMKVNGKDFMRAFYFLSEALFSLIRNKEETFDLKITASKEEKVLISINFPKMPFAIDNDGNLGWDMLQSYMYYNLFKNILENRNFLIKEFEQNIEIEH
ncbi:hypothetical protein [Thermotomaculum hydrothermale]|nr:hypothetical protein [Thermotomaculum hydrothermale]